MKSKLLAATAIPLVSFLAGTSLTNAETFNRPILIAQAEGTTCAEGDAECEARQQEAETPAAAEEAPPEEAVPEEPAAEEPATEPEAPVEPEPEQQLEETVPAEEQVPIPEEAPAEQEQQPEAQQQQAEPEPTTTAEEAVEPESGEAVPEQTEEVEPAAEPEATQEAAPSEEPTAEPAPEATEEQPAEPTLEEPASEDASESEATEENSEPEAAEEAAPSEAETTSDNAETQQEEPSAEPEQATGEEERADQPVIDEEKLKIAEDPTKAEGTVELPVEDGAPILDSAKEAPAEGETAEQPAELQAVPESDAEAQTELQSEQSTEAAITSARERTGTRMDRRPRYERPEGRVVEESGDRVILDFGNGISLRFNDSERIAQDSQDSYYEELPGGYTRQVVTRRNGDEVITIRDRWGDIVQRSRIHDGREYVLYYDPDGYEGNRRSDRNRDRDRGYYDPGRDLPPMRLPVPLSDYIIDTSSADQERDYVDFLSKPPVERVERIYSLDEVRNSARIRDKVRRIDLDTITFETGSAEVSLSEGRSLRDVAEAMNEILDRDPGETFLIEGHTDAVGSDASNLILSDERAESVADVLTGLFDIPPENLATQGYGERYLKVRTSGPERLNRRVTIRRVTPLVRPANARVIE